MASLREAIAGLSSKLRLSFPWGSRLVPLIVATPMKSHVVHVISPIVEVIQVAKPWFPIEILEIALPSHNRSTLLSLFLFPSQLTSAASPLVSAIFEA